MKNLLLLSTNHSNSLSGLYRPILSCIFLLSAWTMNGQCLSTSTPGTQDVQINATGNITVTVTGADGGEGAACTGGSGGSVTATFPVTTGDIIRVIVGAASSDDATASGGGAGTAVINCGNPQDCANGTLLVVAGAGGGCRTSGIANGGGAVTTAGSGNGGGSNGAGGGGGGINSAGTNSPGSELGGGGDQASNTSISSGGSSGSAGVGGSGYGGGGGGGRSATFFYGGGGGGGYTGGDGADGNGGGGGGSNFVDGSGTSVTNTGGATGGSGGDNTDGSVSIIGSCSVLPVELIDFSAKEIARNVELNWQTASEINNEAFQIEHSPDGNNWRNLVTIKGQGTSYQLQNYSYIHQNPNEGINYYRLKQMDYDGQFDYSKVVSVNIKKGNEIAVYPNPSTGLFTISGIDIRHAEVSIYNAVGQLVKEKILTQSVLDMSDLVDGLYYLTVKEGDLVYGVKVVKE